MNPNVSIPFSYTLKKFSFSWLLGGYPCLVFPNTVVIKLECASESLGGLAKTQNTGPRSILHPLTARERWPVLQACVCARLFVPNSPLPVAGQSPWRGRELCRVFVWGRQCKEQKPQLQLGRWLFFLLLLSSFIFISKNCFKKTDCPFFSQETRLLFVVCRAQMLGLWLFPALSYSVIRYSPSLCRWGNWSHHSKIPESGSEFCPGISSLMLIFSEFPYQEITQTLLIPHT